MGRFEPHTRPLTSQLEKWRSEITEMRSLSWPHQKIADWLATEQNFKISGEAIRQFCRVRKISSGPLIAAPERTARQNQSNERQTRRIGGVFEFDESKPIQPASK